MQKIKLNLKETFNFFNNMKLNHVDLFSDLINKYGDCFAIKGFKLNLHVVTNPDFIKYVFIDNYLNYAKTGYNIRFEFVGHPTINKTVERRKNERNIINHYYDLNGVKQHFSSLINSTSRNIQMWEKDLGDGKTFNLDEMISTLVLSNYVSSYFQNALTEISDINNLSKLLRQYFRLINDYSSSFIKIKWHIPTLSWYKKNQLKRKIFVFANLISDYCLFNAGQDENIIKSFSSLYGNVPDARKLLCKKIITLLEPSEILITVIEWAMIYMARYPECANRIRSEVNDNIGSGIFTFENVMSLKYIHAFVMEVIRIECPLQMLSRQVLSNDQFKNYCLKKNDVILIPIFHLQHDPKFWEDPEKFIPERFLHFNPSQHTYNFLAFGCGPHYCGGKNLAIFEVVLV